MAWIMLGVALGFIVGGAIGTVLAPQRGNELITQVGARLRKAREAAQRASQAAEGKTKERHSQSRRRRGRSRRRRRRRR